jgi:hypothetical protein
MNSLASMNKNGLTLNLEFPQSVNCSGSDILQKISINTLLEQESLPSPPDSGFGIKFGDFESFTNHVLANSSTSTPVKGGDQHFPVSTNNCEIVGQQLVPGKPFERFNFSSSNNFNSNLDYSLSTPTASASTTGSFDLMPQQNDLQQTQDNGFDQQHCDQQSHYYYNNGVMSPPSSPIRVQNTELQNLNLDTHLSAGLQMSDQSQLNNYYFLQSINLLQQQQQQQQSLQNYLQQQLLWQNLASSINNDRDRHQTRFNRFTSVGPVQTWTGNLQMRSHRFITYSPKVFLGGIPWDVNEFTLMNLFKSFGEVRIEWPGKEQNMIPPKGYVYVIFESEKQVKALLKACTLQEIYNSDENLSNSSTNSSASSASINNGTVSGNYYYKISSKRIKTKEVEVIPWIIGDSNYMKTTCPKYDPTKTVTIISF